MAATQPAATSRVCVKNLPKHVDEARLKEHFSSKGEVTDVKIIRTKDGKSRLFGFVGFKTEQAAQAAQQFFDRTFFDTSRIAVEFARKVGDTELVRPWSKYSDGSSKHEKLASQAQHQQEDGAKSKGKTGKKTSAAAEPQPEDMDEKLAEFLQLMQPRSKSKLWSNDDVLPKGAAAPSGKAAVRATGKAAAGTKKTKLKSKGSDDISNAEDVEVDESEDDDDYQDFTAAGTPAAGNEEVDDLDDDDDDDDDDDEEEEEEEEQQRVDTGSDLDYLKSRMTVKSFDDDNNNDSDEAFLQRAGASRAPAGVGAADDEDQDEEMGSSDEDGPDEQPGSSSSSSSADEDSEGSGLSSDPAVRGDQSGVGTSAAARAAKLAAAMGLELPSTAAAEHEDAAALEAGQQQGGTSQQHQQQPSKEQATVLASEDGVSIIQDTGRLFVRNLAYSASEADLAQLFGRFGPVEEAHVVLDKLSKRSKGIGYVLFQVPEDAVRAFGELDGQIFQGRLLHVLPARKPPSADAHEQAAGQGGSFKEQREKERKAEAGNRSVWNTLFLRQDTVAEAVAAHYGITKAQLLDRDAQDLPVRMALGEAQVIAQTKQALGDAGVDIAKLEAAAAASGKASLSKSVARSGCVLLLKNLPWATSEEELLDLCSSCGAVARLVLPPTKTLALVEFLEPAEARAAFKALAYRKFHHVPLYVEWAPKDIFALPTPAEPVRQAQVKHQAQAQVSSKASKAGAAAEALTPAADEEETASTTIYVKNLAFSSTEAGLTKHFSKAISAAGGQLVSAKVARRKGTDGQLLSQGYGFVECSSEAVARAVVVQLQGSSLDGHKLALQLSKRKPDAAATAAKSKAKPKAQEGEGAKLVVRNVAFEASRKDIQGLFAPFGHLKSCRLPRKFDGNHRGFAFVEFVTQQEARNALEGVGGIHLYGRRLVVEYAKEDEGLDELRAKTGAKFRADDEAAEPRHKRLKIA